MYNDRALTIDDLAPGLLERAGPALLAALVLDRELAARTRAPTRDEITREQASPMFQLAFEPGLVAMQHERNARLRQLVAPTISVTDAEIDLALRIRTGPRDRVRVLVLPTPAAAVSLRARLLETSDEGAVPEAAIIDAALRESIDDGAALGGLIRALSPLDPGVPAVIREAARTLEPGHLSPVLDVGRRAALVWLGRRIASDTETDLATEGSPEATPVSKATLARDLRRRKEHAAMQQLAVQMLRDARIDVLAPEIAPGWNTLLR